MRTLLVLLLGLPFAACGGGGGGTTPAADLSMPAAKGDMAMMLSCCGKPGDTGNSKGVGKYCKIQDDCAGNKDAVICSTLLGNDTITFCTVPCTTSDAGVADVTKQCGENTACMCNMVGCGCVPTSCLPLKPGCVF